MKSLLVGVKDLRWNRFDKRDLLLCDRFAVPELESFLSNTTDKSAIADIEWLASRDIIFDAAYEQAGDKASTIDPLSKDFQLLGAMLVVMAAVAKRDDSKDEHTIKRLGITGIRGYNEYSLRILSSQLQHSLNTRTIPFLHTSPGLQGWNVRQNLKDIMSDVTSILADYPQSVAMLKEPENRLLADSLPAGLSSIAERLNATSDDVAINEKVTDVAQIVIDALPVPSESMPLEELIDFINTSDVRDDLVRLRRWMVKTTEGKENGVELAEELEYLLQTYREHVAFAKCETDLTKLEVIMSVPFEIAENIVKVQWSKIPQSLIKIQKTKLSLREAERESPGREVAFIHKARKRFE